MCSIMEHITINNHKIKGKFPRWTFDLLHLSWHTTAQNRAIWRVDGSVSLIKHNYSRDLKWYLYTSKYRFLKSLQFIIQISSQKISYIVRNIIRTLNKYLLKFITNIADLHSMNGTLHSKTDLVNISNSNHRWRAEIPLSH